MREKINKNTYEELNRKMFDTLNNIFYTGKSDYYRAANKVIADMMISKLTMDVPEDLAQDVLADLDRMLTAAMEKEREQDTVC